jgi:Fe-S oxidoreductase
MQRIASVAHLLIAAIRCGGKGTFYSKALEIPSGYELHEKMKQMPDIERPVSV